MKLLQAANRLQEAITAGRIFQTRLLLEDGVDLRFVDEEGLSPILRACLIEDEKRRTRTSLIRLLIHHGADVNSTDPHGRHALTVGCILEREDIVRLLLDTSIHNIDLNLKDTDGNTALMHAVRSGNATMVRLLVDALNKFELDIDVRNHEDYTPYLEAKRLAREECAQILATEGRASKYIEVNPFLDFLDIKENYDGGKGALRSVTSVKESKQSQRGINVRQIKSRQAATYPSKHTSKGQKQRVLIVKRKTSLPRKCEIKIQDETANENFQDEIKVAWHEGITPKEKQEGLLNGEEFKRAASDVTVLDRDGNAATKVKEFKTRIPLQISRDKSVLSVDDVTLSHALPRPSSSSNASFRKNGAVTRRSSPRSELTSAPRSRDSTPEVQRANFFVTSLPSQTREQLGRQNIPRARNRPRTAGASFRTNRNDSLPAAASEACSEISWHTHFSTQTSTSAAFIHKLMSMYGEQISPQSSYRCGVRHGQALPPGIVSEDTDDIRSDDRQSSCGSRAGSVRASTPGSARAPSRKFSRTVASFLSNKRAMTTLAMLKSGLKDGATI